VSTNIEVIMIVFDKTYYFELENISFDILQESELNRMFKDGRIASKFLEIMIEKWFPDLQYVNARGHDHVSLTDGQKYEQKCFTKSGCRFMQSINFGGGRVFNEEKAIEHSSTMNYIICDILSFPKIRLIFKKGPDLTNQYSNCIIPLKDLDKLFN
jgi:hypothetical protein